MNFANILKDLSSQAQNKVNDGGGIKGLTNNIPGGLAGGALAGGLVASLFASKSMRKTVTTAAKYGGTAILGGLAYKAYQNWQQNSSQENASQQHPNLYRSSQYKSRHAGVSEFEQEALAHAEGAALSQEFQLALIKAMIASAKADDSIDSDEQKNISDAIDQLGLDPAAKTELYGLFIRPISIAEIVEGVNTMEQKAEVYLASCLVIEIDHQAEFDHLGKLAKTLGIAPDFERQLRAQAASLTANETT